LSKFSDEKLAELKFLAEWWSKKADRSYDKAVDAVWIAFHKQFNLKAEQKQELRDALKDYTLKRLELSFTLESDPLAHWKNYDKWKKLEDQRKRMQKLMRGREMTKRFATVMIKRRAMRIVNEIKKAPAKEWGKLLKD